MLKFFKEEQTNNVKDWMRRNYPELIFEGGPNDNVFWFPSAGNNHIAIKAGACNVAFDVHKYNGHSNNADALWAGVPLVSWPGEDFAARAGAAFLNSIGAPEL